MCNSQNQSEIQDAINLLEENGYYINSKDELFIPKNEYNDALQKIAEGARLIRQAKQQFKKARLELDFEIKIKPMLSSISFFPTIIHGR